jgi:hypothetical protein
MKPIALPEASEKTNSPVTNDRINQLYKSREEALAAHDLACMKMMERTTMSRASDEASQHKTLCLVERGQPTQVRLTDCHTLSQTLCPEHMLHACLMNHPL